MFDEYRKVSHMPSFSRRSTDHQLSLTVMINNASLATHQTLLRFHSDSEFLPRAQLAQLNPQWTYSVNSHLLEKQSTLNSASRVARLVETIAASRHSDTRPTGGDKIDNILRKDLRHADQPQRSVFDP